VSVKFKIIFVLVLLTALALRLYRIDRLEVSGDELTSIKIANGLKQKIDLEVFSNLQIREYNNLEGVRKSTINDNGNGFSYNLVLHSWCIVFGSSNTSTRSVSLIFGMAVLCIVYLFTKYLFKDIRIALLAMFFVSIHPIIVDYAQVSRPYSLALFLSLLSTWILFLMIERERKTGLSVVYVLLVVLSLLTHYLTISVFIAHFLIVVLLYRDRRILFHYFLSGLAIVILFGIWLINGGLDGKEIMDQQSTMYSQLALNYTEGANSFNIPATFPNILTGLIQIWLPVFGNYLQLLGFRIREISVLLVIPISLLLIVFISNYQKLSSNKKFISLFLIVSIQSLFALIMAINSGHCISFQTIYTMFVLPYSMGLLAFAAIVLYKTKKAASVFYMLAISIILCISLVPLVKGEGRPGCFNNVYMSEANDIKITYKKNDTVYVRSFNDAKFLNIYLPDDLQIMQKVDTTLTSVYKY